MELNKKLDRLFENNASVVVKKGYKQFFVNLYYLFKTSLFIIREDWLWYLLMICIRPLSIMIFLGFYFQDSSNDIILFIITGNMVMSIVTGTMLTLGQNLGMLKQYKAFDYYATLPVSKIALIIALVTRTTILVLPSMLTIFLIGNFYFGLEMTFHPLILLIIFISGYSLSGIGAIIGIYSRNMQTASLITQIVQPIVVFMAPVMIPENYLPRILKYTSHLMPTTYVARALRGAVVGQIAYFDLVIILIVSVISIYLVGVKLDWRVEN